MTGILLRRTQVHVTHNAGKIGAPEFVQLPLLAVWVARTAMITSPATQTVLVDEALELSIQAEFGESIDRLDD